MRRRLRLCALAPLLLLGGGVSAGAGESRDWARQIIPAAGRLLAVAMPASQPAGEVLTVVFEGDGAAHDSRGHPAADPTPAHATGLDIARRWPNGPRAWVGRLCQYVRAQDPACGEADWTTGRFSEAAVAAADAAVDGLKARTGAGRVNLVGWSGGGVLAVLVAQRRGDVAGVVTMAAPLDLAGWTRDQGLSPLQASLDPSARGWSGPSPPQVHLQGVFDRVVPPREGSAAARRLAGSNGVVVLMPEEHACCWPRRAAEAARLLKALAR